MMVEEGGHRFRARSTSADFVGRLSVGRRMVKLRSTTIAAFVFYFHRVSTSRRLRFLLEYCVAHPT